MTRVTVIMGGWSRERSVSLSSGKQVANTLSSCGFHVTSLDLTPDLPSFISQLLLSKPDIVFNATHGTFGEDGSLQALLDSLSLPYTHSSSPSSHLAFHKHLSSSLLSHHGLTCPPHKAVCPQDLISTLLSHPSPCVAKPSSEGSSLDVHIFADSSAQHNFSPPPLLFHYPMWMIEDFIPGRELTVAVLNGQALAVTEIFHSSPLYTYEEKYSSQSHHVCPANLSPTITQHILDLASKTFSLLQCQGLARVDFRFNEKYDKEGVFILEINTQPGLTPVSLAPEQALAIGINFPSLLQKIIDAPSSPS